MCTTESVTTLVHNYANGDRASLNSLMPLVYPELRRMAQRHLRNERPDHTLQATALVNELYMRLNGQTPPAAVHDRPHFLAVASQVMRQVLVDHARLKYAQKRGGRQEMLPLDESLDACMEKPGILEQVDDALDQLARHDPRKAQLIEMRFFGGLTAEESAGALGLPVQVVRRELRVAQAWLQRELQQTSTKTLASAS